MNMIRSAKNQIAELTAAAYRAAVQEGVLPEESCYTDESHWNGLLEYPQYSRPEEWHGRKVPEVLLSGHHGNVADWRTRESYKRTMMEGCTIRFLISTLPIFQGVNRALYFSFIRCSSSYFQHTAGFALVL